MTFRIYLELDITNGRLLKSITTNIIRSSKLVEFVTMNFKTLLYKNKLVEIGEPFFEIGHNKLYLNNKLNNSEIYFFS